MGRFLRVAVIRAGRVLEERLLPMGADITIGTAPNNDFVVSDAKLPKTSLLFKARGPEGHALFVTKPNGEIALDGQESSAVGDLIKAGLASKRDKGWLLPLPRAARGKVEVGDLNIYFQYVERDLALVKNQKGPRPMALEITLSWGGTALQTASFTDLRPVSFGPLPDCDFHIPGPIFGAARFPLVVPAGNGFAIDLAPSAVSVTRFERDGTEQAPPEAKLAITGAPFLLEIDLGDAFTAVFRYSQTLARPTKSVFDIQDPKPFLTLAGSAVVHAVILLIAFSLGQSLLDPNAAKAAKEQARREIRTMLVDQRKKDEKREQEKAADAKKKADEAPKEEAKEVAKEEKKEEKKPTPPKPEPPREAATTDMKPSGDPGAGDKVSPEARRTQVTKEVRAKTFLNAIGNEGEGEGGPFAAAKSTSFASAFDDVDAPYAANGGEGSPIPAAPKAVGGEGGERYKTLSSAETGGDRIATQKVTTTAKGAGEEASVKANVGTGKLGSEGGLGQIDRDSVARVFSRRKGAIRACYEKELQRNKGLSGRITVRFTIGTAGRVTDISTTQNTTGDDAIAACIVDKVRGWKFDPPSGGAVTFTFPFILSAS